MRTSVFLTLCLRTRPMVIGTSRAIETAVQPVRLTTSRATATCPGPRPLDCQVRKSVRSAITSAPRIARAMAGTELTRIAITLATRKQADQSEANRDETSPSVPSLT